MEFDYFLSVISKLQDSQLGGFSSHQKMIPKERRLLKKIELESANPRKAAVLALFYPDELNLTNFCNVELEKKPCPYQRYVQHLILELQKPKTFSIQLDHLENLFYLQNQ